MRHLFAVVLLLCSATVAAEQTDERLDLARQLVGLLQVNINHPESGGTCIPAPEKMRKDLADSYRKSPAGFYGISPQSAYWSDVEKAWREYYVERCSGRIDELATALLAGSFAESMSSHEMREVIAFQSSAAGRAFFAASRQACEVLVREMSNRLDRQTERASKSFRVSMLSLKAKYEVDPK
jgi:hypothetical protein